MNLYSEVKSKINDDDKYCAPLAVSLVTGVPFKKVRAVMERLGRRRGCGTPRHITFKTLEELGFACRMLNSLAREYKTVTTLEKGLRHRKMARFLVFTRNHALAVVNGQVQDWTANRRHRVKYVFLVEPK